MSTVINVYPGVGSQARPAGPPAPRSLTWSHKHLWGPALCPVLSVLPAITEAPSPKPPAWGKPSSPVAHAELAQDPAATVADTGTIAAVLLSILQSHPAEEQLLAMVYSLLTIVASQGGCRLGRPRALGTERAAPSPSTGAQTPPLAALRPHASLCLQAWALPGGDITVGFRFLPLLPLRPLRPTSQWPPASPGRGAAWGRGSPPRALPKLTPV